MSDRPVRRLPLRTGLGRPGDDVRDDGLTGKLPAPSAEMAEYLRKNAARVAQLTEDLRQALRAGLDASEEKEDMIKVQTIALLTMGFIGMQKFDIAEGGQMLTAAMNLASEKHRASSDKTCKKLEKLHARGEDVSRLVPSGLGFNAKGKLVPLSELETPPNGGVQQSSLTVK